MARGKKEARCKIDFTQTAIDDLADLPPFIRERIFKRLDWLACNHDAIQHHGLKYMPVELAGLKKRREGNYRILYWYYPEKDLMRIYGVAHRSKVYKEIGRF